MESAALRRAPALRGQVQVGLVALLLGLAAASWAVSDDRMAGMDAGPASELGDVGWFIGVWLTMMAAMMLPSLAPAVLVHARVQAAKRDREGVGPIATSAVFVAGYLLPWTIAGLAGYAIVEGARALEPGFLAWGEAGRYLAGAVILAAALYELTPLKDACLRNCRAPLAFADRTWRPGHFGALRMGIEHGGFCVGCCWALMAVLFALGVMSIAWMVFVAALIAAEKLLPRPAIVTGVVAIVLAALAIAVALAPADVPGFTVPGSPDAAPEMETMGM